jgi:hypothetical protein
VLGRAGFLEAFDFCIHGDALTLTRRGSFPYWLDRICTLLSLPFVRARSSEEPL